MEQNTAQKQGLQGFKKGEVVEASSDITTGLLQSDVIVPVGTRLVVRGPSGNALHPIAVAKESDEHFGFAASARDLRKITAMLLLTLALASSGCATRETTTTTYHPDGRVTVTNHRIRCLSLVE